MATLDSRVLETALARLVSSGTLTAEQSAAVRREVKAVPAPTSRRVRLSEVAGYAGGALVAAAGLLFVTQTWGDLSRTGRAGLLLVITLGLTAGAALVVGRRWSAITNPQHDVRRRLASTLLTGAAGALAGLTAVALDVEDTLWPGLVLLVAAVAVVVRVPAGIAELAAWLGGLLTLLGVLQATDAEGTALGVTLVTYGLLWAALALTSRLRAPEVAGAAGLGTAIVSSFALAEQDDARAYLTVGVVGVLALAGYLRVARWSYVAGGVAGLTIAVTWWANDVAGDSVGVAGLVLIAGLTLIAVSAVGLRIRKGHDEYPGPPVEPAPNKEPAQP